MISSLLHLVGLQPRVYYTLTNFRGGGGKAPLAPPPQYANADALKFIKESKYLGFTFSDSKSDDCDIYVKTNETILYSGVARGASAPRRRLERNCQSSTRAVRVI